MKKIIITSAAVILLAACKKDGGCEKWLVGYEFSGCSGHLPEAPTIWNICDKQQLKEAHSGNRIVVSQSSGCVVYKVYYRQLN